MIVNYQQAEKKYSKICKQDILYKKIYSKLAQHFTKLEILKLYKILYYIIYTRKYI